MPIRVGQMPYLNSAVFYHTLPKKSCHLVPLVPRLMAKALEASHIVAGPLAIADVIRLGKLVKPLSDLCVATKGKTVSILLFCRRDVSELSGASVGITNHTSSSVQLLRVLFAERWSVHPKRYTQLNEECDAKLFIGDPALQNKDGIDGFPYVYDLGEEWFNHTNGMPFVYARWVSRSDADTSEIRDFEASLRDAFREGMTRLPEIVKLQNGLGMSVSEKLEYLRGFIYRFGVSEKLAVDRFRESLALLPEWRPNLSNAEVL